MSQSRNSSQGRSGEWLFGHLCSSNPDGLNVVVNSAADDQHGWDQIIEISETSENSLPADLVRLVFRAFVQIKTTRGKNLEARIKLSNAIKSCQSSTPFFVFMFQFFDDHCEPQLYGIHIWKEHIEAWLKKAREQEHNNAKNSLHNVTVSLRFSEKDRIADNPARWIKRSIEIQEPNYATKKEQILANAGYGEITHHGEFSLRQDITTKEVVEHTLGLTRSLPLDKFTLHDRRFDILSRYPNVESIGGEVSIEVHPRPVSLLISNGSDSILAPAKILMPALISFGDPEFRTRLICGQIDLVTNSDQKRENFSNNIDFEGKWTVSEQLAFLRLLDWSKYNDVSVSVDCEYGTLFSLYFEKRDSQDSWVEQASWNANFLYLLFGNEAQQEKVSLCDILQLGDVEGTMARLLESKSIKLSSGSLVTIEFDGLIFFATASVLNHTFFFLIELERRAESVNEALYSFYFLQPIMSNVQKFSTEWQVTEQFARHRLESRGKTKLGNWATIGNGSLNDLITSMSNGEQLALRSL